MEGIDSLAMLRNINFRLKFVVQFLFGVVPPRRWSILGGCLAGVLRKKRATVPMFALRIHSFCGPGCADPGRKPESLLPQPAGPWVSFAVGSPSVWNGSQGMHHGASEQDCEIPRQRKPRVGARICLRVAFLLGWLKGNRKANRSSYTQP